MGDGEPGSLVGTFRTRRGREPRWAGGRSSWCGPGSAMWVIGLAAVLGLPDDIWGTATHLVFLGAVAVVALANTLAAALIRNVRP